MIQKKERAITLRKKGLSLKEIAEKLQCPKSTIRYWCRDITLSPKQLRRLYRKQQIGGILGAEKKRNERIRITADLFQQGLHDMGNLSQKEKLVAGAALYWAEGYRKGDGEFGFTNSDPNMIRFIIVWLRTACHIEQEQIHLRICINAIHKPHIENIKKSWVSITEIPVAQFSKPTFIKMSAKKIYTNRAGYLGTLRIKVKNSTNLRRKILGWIGGIARLM